VKDSSVSLLIAVLGAAGAVVSVACNDNEVHDEQVAALGPEQPGVPPGPTHRPGQPCVTCHGGSGPAKSQFSIGGTVYETQGQLTPSVGSTVVIEDIDGNVWTTSPTNSAGNFYVYLSDFAPHYPTQPTVVPEDGSQTILMATHIGRDGSCADCHANPAGPSSPGPVYSHRVTTQ